MKLHQRILRCTAYILLLTALSIMLSLAHAYFGWRKPATGQYLACIAYMVTATKAKRRIWSTRVDRMRARLDEAAV